MTATRQLFASTVLVMCAVSAAWSHDFGSHSSGGHAETLPAAVGHPPFDRALLVDCIEGLSPFGISAAVDATDIDVTFIERTPRYNFDAAKNNPAIGDTVTFHGHVKHWGNSTLASVSYRWQLDGGTVHTGTLTNVAPGEERIVTWSWTWQGGDHWIKLTADPDNLVAELSEVNNEIEDRTNAIIAGFWVEQSVYDYFHNYQRMLGVGSNSWEDWIQRHMAKQNELYVQAIWPSAPQGVLDRVRIDKLIVVPDGALPLSWGLPTNNPDARDKTVDLMWGFPATLLNGSFYSNVTSTSENNPFFLEKSLIHELGHARYLIDNYGFDVHNTSTHHSVQIYEGDTYVAGSAYMPFVAFGEVLYYNKNGGVMSGPYGFQWSPYEAAALNLISGKRAECGNYNAPCNIGVYLQDLPQNNHLRFTDDLDRPRANASVKIYRAAGASGIWYGKTFDDIPDAEYTTDLDGYIHLPRNPFNPGGTVRHTYGVANGVMILRVQHIDQTWYRFVEATDFNLAYWAGDTQDADYTIVLDGPNDDLDADGLDDDWELQYFLDLLQDGSGDVDTDGLDNLGEYNAGTNPTVGDTDGDTLSDGDEVHVHDTDPTLPDTDADELDDAEEIARGTNPRLADTDKDNMPDGWEVEHGLNPLVNDANLDPDNDGFSSYLEFESNSDPMAPWSIPILQYGTALSFDGIDDFVRFGDVAVSGSQLTAECWVKPQATGSARLLDKLQDYSVQLTGANVVRFMTRHGFTWDTLDGATTLPEDTWTHVACVLTGTKKQVYVNGQLDAEKDYAYAVTVTTNALIVGADSPSTTQGWFTGELDDVRVWQVAHSASMLQAKMNELLSGDESGLVGYWDFNDAAGQVALDRAGTLDGQLGATGGADVSDPAWVSSSVTPGSAQENGPLFSNVMAPTFVSPNAPAVVTVEISDELQGDDGVGSAILYYDYAFPYNANNVLGASPGGSGDGTWSFTIPAQGAGALGQNLLFFLRADDGANNPSFDSNLEMLYAVSIGLPGDGDGDGDVDLADLALFVPCVTGPLGGGLSPACSLFDVDDDGAVDLEDFAGMQLLFDTGN